MSRNPTSRLIDDVFAQIEPMFRFFSEQMPIQTRVMSFLPHVLPAWFMRAQFLPFALL